MYNYDRNIVIAAYRVANPDQNDIKEKALTDFDAGLFQTYDPEVRRQAQAKQIPISVFTRSMLVFFASQSLLKSMPKRVAQACRVFDSVRPQPSTAVGATPIEE